MKDIVSLLTEASSVIEEARVELQRYDGAAEQAATLAERAQTTQVRLREEKLAFLTILLALRESLGGEGQVASVSFEAERYGMRVSLTDSGFKFQAHGPSSLHTFADLGEFFDAVNGARHKNSYSGLCEDLHESIVKRIEYLVAEINQRPRFAQLVEGISSKMLVSCQTALRQLSQ